MADILPFAPKKPDRLGRAAGITANWETERPPRLEVLTCPCRCQRFVCEWPTGDIICAECGTRSNNFQLVQIL